MPDCIIISLSFICVVFIRIFLMVGFKMIKRIRNNIKFIINKFTLIASVVFGLVSVVQMFISWESLGINETKYKVAVLLGLLFLCGIISLIYGLFFSKRKTVFSKDEVEIEVKYGDLMKIAFPKKREEKIVVIAVNRCFDMVISQELISDRSMHGQFLKRFVHNDTDLHNLETAITNSLSGFNYEPVRLDRADKRYGNLERYPLGSIARVNGHNGVTFFLLGLTEFDKDCKAHCDKHQYIECLLKLFEYYDAHGQGMDLYLYPMGTSMARTGLSKQEALESVIALTKISKDCLKAKTTIVVDKKCRNDISITDF